MRRYIASHVPRVTNSHRLVSDGELTSLDLPTILAGGYQARATAQWISQPPRLHPALRTTYRLAGSKPVRVELCVDISRGRLQVCSFPYVDERQRLRLWDVNEGEPLRVVGHGVINGGLPPELVRKRFPRLFEWAQRRGYWKDV